MTEPTGFLLYDLLGVTDAAAAALLWPGDKLSMVEGYNVTNDAPACVAALQGALLFNNLRLGSDPTVEVGAASSPGGGLAGQVTFAVDLTVHPVDPLVDLTFYVRDLPNVGINLLETAGGKPATVYFARDGRGYEVLIEGLPVELRLPGGFLTPAKDTDSQDGDTSEWSAGDDDSVAIVKMRGAPSVIRTHVRLHLTPDGDVLVEPNTPLNIDSAKFSNLPVTALHDLLIIPSPRRRDLYEWARNDLTPLLTIGPQGAFGLRSILVDLGKPPFADLVKRFQDNSGVQSANVELVLEDVVIPASGFGFPLPVHGTFGIRRKITDRNSIEQAYSMADAPYRIRVYSRDGTAATSSNTAEGLYFVINQLEFRTGSVVSENDSAPVLELQAQLVWQSGLDAQDAKGGTLGIGDDWVVQVGLTLGSNSPVHIMTIADADISINAIKGGLRLTTLDDMSNAWQALVDISIRDISKPAAPDAKPSAFKLTTLTGKPLDVILRDIGWSFGHLQLGTSIAAPEGLQLVFGGVFRLVIEELGFVEEPGGGTYFSFSGGIEIGAANASPALPTSTRTPSSGTGTGIIFRRLRFLTSDTPDAPPWKLDGVYIDIHYGEVSISGFGYITDDTENGVRYQELGFGVQLQFPLGATTFKVAAEFLKGTATEVAAPNTSFTYMLAALTIGYIPAGTLGIYAIRGLFAYNMQPALDPPGEDGESMQLYQWHKDHDGAIDMPRSRNLADWTPVNNSLAVGIGLGISFNSAGQLFHIGAFALVTHSETDNSLLIVGELFLLKNPDSIAFLAVDWDFTTGKFGIMAGVNLGLDKFVGTGTLPAWIADLAKLTGTIYYGNQPDTLAIGQLSDQRSWLGITVSAKWLKLKVRMAIGLQIVDGGPKGFGFVTSFTGGDDWGIGKFQVYGSLGFIYGAWKTGSDSSGVHVWFQIGFKMSVFYVFSVGMEVDVDLTYLGKNPWYTTLTAQIHIDTPWFLPDVTFQISNTWNESKPFDTSTTTQALSAGDATSPLAPTTPTPLHVPALTDGNTDPAHLYSFNQLSAVNGAAVDGVVLPSDLTPVAVDADIAINFTNPVANDAAIATQSYPVDADPGTQKVQDITVRYALKSVQIQRRPRFGPGSDTWTDLVAASDTALDLSGGGSVHATPAVSFAWDADNRADGVVAPTRLLINCRTPYTFVTGSSQNDEEALGNDDGFPCCQLDPVKGFQIPWHDLSWTTTALGVRLPTTESFSDNGALWSWTAAPAAMNGVGDYAGRIVAVCLVGNDTVLGSVDLAGPAVTFAAQLLPMSPRVTCTLNAYNGLDLLATQNIVGGTAAAAVTLAGTIAKPITHVTLLVAVAALEPHAVAENPWGPLGAPAVMVYDLRYQSLADVIAVTARKQRCQNSGSTSGVGGGGKLAFLPNYDYAVTTTVDVTLTHTTGGSKTLTLQEPAFFRTKGLLGLNASPNVGDELQPYVASTYPPVRSVPLYRTEPVSVAFTEDMSNLLPVDRVAAPGDPPEKAQLMQLALSVDRIASTEGALRLTATSQDWLTAHGGVVVVSRPPFMNGLFAGLAIRKAASQDLQVLRFEAVLDAAGCDHNAIHSSQVLTHAPVGPDGTPGTWESQASMRATLRAQDGPYTERSPFVQDDLGAFSYLDDTSGGSPAWSLVAGTLVAPGTARHYAAFGDPSWNHYQVSTTVDPAGGIAGIGIGLSGTSPVQQGMLALIDNGALVLVRRTAGVDTEMVRAPLPASTGPLNLYVTAFDDIVRATVGDVVLEAERDVVREGRAALVADGSAVFSALLVESLDMYRVDFVTSRYLSFADHVASRDQTTYVHASDAMGAAPASTPAAVIAAQATEIASAMATAASPQQRQQLFAQVVSDIGLAQLQRCDRLTLTRLTDTTGTTALLLESPEPLSFLHDATLGLLHRTWRPPLPWQQLPGVLPAVNAALAQLHLSHAGLVAPVAAARVLIANHCQVALITSGSPTFSMDVYDVPVPTLRPVLLHRVATLNAHTAVLAGLGALVHEPAGALIAVRPDHSIAGIVMSGPVEVDVPVPLTLLSNGDETSTLALFSAPLGAGTYVLNLGFNRTRWVTTVADPAAVYQDSASLQLTW